MARSKQDRNDLDSLLRFGTMDIKGLLTRGSNYTFLVKICDRTRETLAIYKPIRGERPLWDFPTGTLANRECAAYLVSVALGWPNVPLTILREGPIGPGMVQLFIKMVDGQHFFTLRDQYDQYRDEMKRIAAFDSIINNADRKGGHVLLGADEKIWCIDHGVTFHEHPKLRTVIWDFTAQPVPHQIREDLSVLLSRLQRGGPLGEALKALLSQHEINALGDRLDHLIESGIFPEPSDDWPSVPWPPV